MGDPAHLSPQINAGKHVGYNRESTHQERVEELVYIPLERPQSDLPCQHHTSVYPCECCPPNQAGEDSTVGM